MFFSEQRGAFARAPLFIFLAGLAGVLGLDKWYTLIMSNTKVENQKELSARRKTELTKAVKKTVKQYKKTFVLLAKT